MVPYLTVSQSVIEVFMASLKKDCPSMPWVTKGVLIVLCTTMRYRSWIACSITAM